MSPSKKMVVIVDDDVDVGRAVVRLLKAAGFDTCTFGSGEALLEANPAADCFVLDIQMPGMSGLDLADRLRAAGVRTPLIFITAHDDPLHRARARAVGAIGFAIKPFESDALLGPLAAAMR